MYLFQRCLILIIFDDLSLFLFRMKQCLIIGMQPKLVLNVEEKEVIYPILYEKAEANIFDLVGLVA